MKRTIIDVNILHTVPPSNMNRDDTGSPKSAVYGGVRRARVSSQAWKRATRLSFNEHLDRDQLGLRSKRVVEILAARIQELDDQVSAEDALGIAQEVFTSAGIKVNAPKAKKGDAAQPAEAGYLLFLSNLQIDQLARIACDALAAEDRKESLKGAAPKKALHLNNSVDLALFGRMVADSSDLNVDAAVQVAHAISVHAVESEFDYFTAVDDAKQANVDEIEQGAAMIGQIEFNSSTLYRYATIDVNLLQRNLGSADATARAVEAFLQAFITSMPTGKQNTFANRTLPDAVVVSVRNTQSVNLVGAFEEAVSAQPRIHTAAEKLAAYSVDVDECFGTTPVASWVVATGGTGAILSKLGEKCTVAELVTQAGQTVMDRIQGE